MSMSSAWNVTSTQQMSAGCITLPLPRLPLLHRASHGIPAVSGSLVFFHQGPPNTYLKMCQSLSRGGVTNEV